MNTGEFEMEFIRIIAGIYLVIFCIAMPIVGMTEPFTSAWWASQPIALIGGLAIGSGLASLYQF